jgi:hypothetical protein
MTLVSNRKKTKTVCELLASFQITVTVKIIYLGIVSVVYVSFLQ